MTTDTWAVRPATTADQPAIAAIITGCGLFPEDEAQGFIGMLPGLLADPDQHWLLTEQNGQTHGAAYFSLDGISQDVWNLWFIGLIRATQGQGGGSALIRAVEDNIRAKGARLLLVETSSLSTFTATRGFYDSRGYSEEARIRDYYATGDDKVIYRKAL